MAEWFKAAVLKTSVGGSPGPTMSLDWIMVAFAKFIEANPNKRWCTLRCSYGGFTRWRLPCNPYALAWREVLILRWLRPSRERDDRTLFKSATPLPEIDPIDELARIIGDAQEQDAEDEQRFDDLALSHQRRPLRAVRTTSRHIARRGH
jgi:hypothetical protein